MASDRAAPEEAQPEKQVGEMMQDLKINPGTASKDEVKSANGKQAPASDASPSEATSSVTSLGDSASTKGSEVEQEGMVEQGLYYPPSNNYYGVVYPGYEVVGNDWDEHGGIVGVDGVEYPYAGIHAENGSLLYYVPSYGYTQPAYNPYNPYIPGAVYGVDGQFLAHQPYYPGHIYQQPFTPTAFFQPPVAYGSEVPPPFPWDSGLVVAANGNGVNGNSAAGVPRTNNSVASVPYSKVTTSARKSVAGLDPKGPMHSSEVLQPSSVPGGQPASHSTGPQSLRPLAKITQHGSTVSAGVVPKGFVQIGKVAGNQGKPILYPNHVADVKANGHEWIGGGDRLKLRGKVPSGNLDALNEQNRGPRINKTRNPWVSAVDTSDQESLGNDGYGPVAGRDQYNLAEFPTKYDNASFFVIKSYSEDDVHKSIKYSVWASTPNGNKRLDGAYQTAKERSGGKPGSCPVFLFFSVNASGQFCGVAEMTGPVDFNKSMPFWQQDKWNGYFPVKWHIIKDISNSQFRHIILENNDNKPVTNSRDTQEIRFLQGIEMLNIFKNFSSKTSILDDFMFYESRQKTMQEKKRMPYQQEPLQILGRYDAVQKKGSGEQLPRSEKGSGEQLNRSDGEVKPGVHAELKAVNGSQVPASTATKHTSPEPSVVTKDRTALANVVDMGKGEPEGTGDGRNKKEHMGKSEPEGTGEGRNKKE
ncbi:YTH domain-containing protein ECT4 isoform X1 [Cryptomeria japonica]|uniref:YTH domain-containing protein ECT4 isoform X1 n=1 Tax=Cryptomeria japonica TaxID=3369 RepID=UPI0027DAACB4|nr:YTH domain-containing protein ECT4 isoform X1 [Cryptomeria japonica]